MQQLTVVTDYRSELREKTNSLLNPNVKKGAITTIAFTTSVEKIPLRLPKDSTVRMKSTILTIKIQGLQGSKLVF